MLTSRTRRLFVSALSLLVAGIAFAWTVPCAEASGSVILRDITASGGSGDVLILRDGRIVQGRILEETATEVRFELRVGNITAPTVYRKADILEIQRGAERTAKPDESARSEGRDAGRSSERRADPGETGAPAVAVLELTGYFGRDIAVTPIRNALNDIAQAKPDVLILVIDNAWQRRDGSEAPDDEAEFQRISLAERIEPVLSREFPQRLGYEPRIVVWVKKAMGGACFLPFNFGDIYFHPDGKMGGIGNLLAMYGNTGDEMVREKLFSAWMAHARGMAHTGGYDPRIVTAMARMDYVLSYRMTAGRAELLERLPEGPNEFLLTNDGTQDEFKDSIQALARGDGKNTLTLDAKSARDLGVSKGTVSTIDELLFELQLHRRHRMLDTRSKQVMERWSRDIEAGERNLRRLVQDYAEIQVQGDYNQRQAARSLQIRRLREMQQILERFREVAELGLMRLDGVPDLQTIDVEIERIRQDQMRDRR